MTLERARPAGADPRVDRRPLAVAVMGPTASGKTAFAVDWAQRLGTEVVSVDSALVYRRLDIGSAKPDAETLSRAPHRLIDVREPHDPYSAADFASDARAAMDDLAAAGRVPLLVGGTGLYFRALFEGLSALPASDPAVRAALQGELASRGLGALHDELRRLDPVAGARIQPGDTQRTLRALEVYRLSGRTLTDWHAQPRAASIFPFRVLTLVLAPSERDVLHRRISRRFHDMLAAGFLDEVRALRADPRLHPDLPALRAVGYRQAWRHLDGQTDAATFVVEGIAATRHLAKRQLTWLRGLHHAIWFDPLDERARLDAVMRGFLGLR